MKINVIVTPGLMEELYYANKNTVVIDVLRASTSIVTALNNGAKEVIPVASVEFAVKLSGSGQTLLCGERNTKKIEGFALGNSPLEYKREVVEGKSIVFFSTNGTKAIVKAKFSTNLFICSFNNISAVAAKLVNMNNDLEIVCSGRNGDYSLEDSLCAGKLLSILMEQHTDVSLNDAAQSSLALNKVFGKHISKTLKESDHGKLLIENGFIKDIDFCSKLDTLDVVPYYSSNVIKI